MQRQAKRQELMLKYGINNNMYGTAGGSGYRKFENTATWRMLFYDIVEFFGF